MARLFAEHPEALAQTGVLLSRIDFSLEQLKYNYPTETVGNGETAQQTLERLTWEGARKRYPDGIPQKVVDSLESELRLIDELKYASYFLTVQDIVRFARYERQILCQGRGSAANSAVCYCLEITEVDPDKVNLVFGRFLSTERNEPPDIDVDFEHERREEVMQYVYDKYGGARTGLTATVITYRSKSAVRETAKVFGISDDTIDALNQMHWGWGSAVDLKGVKVDRARPGRSDRHADAERRRGAEIASPGISASTWAASSSPAIRSRAWCRSARRRWRAAPSSSGTRTTSMRSASSRSISWRWGCSPASGAPSSCCTSTTGAT